MIPAVRDVGEAMEVFDGVMASDGTIGPANFATPRFALSVSGQDHLDWLSYVKSALEVLDVRMTGPAVSHCTGPTGKPYDYCQIRSKASPIMVKQRLRWYPNGLKVIPEDTHFSLRWLAHCFMGDGCSGVSRLDSRHPQIDVDLCLENFDTSSINLVNNFLWDQGFKAHYSNHRYSRTGAGIRLRLYQKDAENFISAVAPYVVPSYQYKIKHLEVE